MPTPFAEAVGVDAQDHVAAAGKLSGEGRTPTGQLA
jgi:hypothetical protein